MPLVRPVLAVVAALVAGLVVASPAGAASAVFSFTGGEQSFTVPSGVGLLHVFAVGAPGATNGGSVAGAGAVVGANLTVSSGQVLFVEVGGVGQPAGPAGSTPGATSFNGGGGGGSHPPVGAGGAGGGGASDVRTCSMLGGGCAAPSTLASRLVVAGGGGGAGGAGSGEGGAGLSATTFAVAEGTGRDGTAGAPGKDIAQAGGGGGGTGGGGGAAGAQGGGPGSQPGSAGGFGSGGNGGHGQSSGGTGWSGGGGGGGWYGGGGGGGAGSDNNGGGGGGGSSFVAASQATNASFATDATGQPKVVVAYRGPTANTGSADAVSATSATLHASVDPEGDETIFQFELGTQKTPLQSAGSTPGARQVSASVAGLKPNTTYHYRVVASNSTGFTRGGDRTFELVLLPTVSGYAINPGAFFAAGGGGSVQGTRAGGVVRFRLNTAASVAFKVQRRKRGRRGARGRCVKPNRRNRRRRRCTRYVTLRGGFTRRGVAGPNRFRFTGRLRGRKLRPGRYRLVATPTSHRHKGRARNAAFRIKRTARRRARRR